MERAVFDRMAAQEEAHWWFAGRREIIAAVIKRLVKLPETPRILEAGCGTGGNLSMLSEFGALRAFELDETARAVACDKSGLAVAQGALPGPIPFEHEHFDLIGLFDVLEHVEDDRAALAALAARLQDGGKIVMTVPAFQALWSAHDERHHHFRRYSRRHLAEVAQAAGLKVDQSFYFNTFLFPVAVAARAVKTLFRIDAADDTMPKPATNGILRAIFSFEQKFVGRIKAPFGLSLCAVLSLPEK